MGYHPGMTPTEVTARLRKPLERALSQGHPWIYRDALDPLAAEPGTVVAVTDARGRFVARGIADAGPLAVRVYTTRDEVLGPALLTGRMVRAAELRDRVLPPETDAYRLLHGEGDRLPGVVCDVYGPWAVLALDGEGMIPWRESLVGVLSPVLRARGVTSLLVRSGRGDRRVTDLAWGELPDGPMDVRERGMLLRVDLVRGQKTGAFLDQRESRHRVRRLAGGMRVLNLYGYTGGFSVAAGLGGAGSVETVDVAPAAVALATEAWAHNGLDPARHTATVCDVPELLAERLRARARYDLVVADPPSFAPSEATLEAALRSYRALHAAALGLVSPGGYYLAGSCSSHVDRSVFLGTVLDGAAKLRRVLQVVDAWAAPEDHPRLAAFPEGDYLKVLLLRVMD